MTPPAKPYIYHHGGRWCVQWHVGSRRRLLAARSFRDACRYAAAIRRWQLS